MAAERGPPGGAVGAALVGLEPGPPGRLRDALAAALGDSTLQLAFRQPGRRRLPGHQRAGVDPARLRPGGC